MKKSEFWPSKGGVPYRERGISIHVTVIYTAYCSLYMLLLFLHATVIYNMPQLFHAAYKNRSTNIDKTLNFSYENENSMRASHALLGGGGTVWRGSHFSGGHSQS